MLLKEKVFVKMKELCDDPVQIIYKNHKTTSKSLEMYIVIIKIPSFNSIPRFRVYKGLQYNKNISIEYFTIEEDMYLAMASNLDFRGGVIHASKRTIKRKA